MSTSKVPSQKKKRKYTNWDTQPNMGLQSIRHASRRSSMLGALMRAANTSKNNDAVSSNATSHVPLPACVSSQQSQTPVNSPSMLPASMLAAVYSKKNDAVSSNATLHVPLPACVSSQQSQAPVNSLSMLAANTSKKNDSVSSNATLHGPLPACVSSQQSQAPINSPLMLAANTSKKNDAVSSNATLHVPLPACVSSQQSQTPVNSPSMLTASILAANTSKKNDAVSSTTLHVPLPACVSSQESQIPVNSPSMLTASILAANTSKKNYAVSSNATLHVPLPAYVSSQQSQTPVNSPSMLTASILAANTSKKNDAVSSNATLHVPLPACVSSQQSQTPVNSPSYLHSGDCNYVCEYCGSYFWHGERVKSFSTNRQPKYIRCCKGATSDTLAEESCSGSTHTKQRLCSGKGSGESVQQSGTKDKIESGSSEVADEVSSHSTPDLEEYWVPVHLSSMQIEQYCSILVSNSDALFSSSKTSSLYDVITQTQKCCDHPYLMDPTLRNSPKEPSLIDPLAAEINVSGKLHVFYKILLEIKQRGLRALVLFHSAVNSEKISTGQLLDDLVNQRFGENSYVYIPGWILSHSAYVKKKESLEMFNKAESDRFICLCDHLACLSSLKLSRVDVVILFNSDRKPSNDIKALKRITIDSHCEQLKVFRFYSTFTVEEKALILSKQGTTVDSNISRSVCYQLLAWGAAYLFTKLPSSTNSRPQSFIDNLVHELSSLLRNTSVGTGPTNRSIISHAHMQNGAYSGSILLYGETETHTKESLSLDEYLIGKKHYAFWSNSVKQSRHVPEKCCSSSSTHEKQRLCSGQGSGESVQQSGTKDKMESGSSELADDVSTEIHNHILPYVTKLFDHRNRGQNAVFFDGQERLAKVACFVSSLLGNMKKPILIIASSSALLLWEIEFIKWSKSVNVVTYRGTDDIRAAIRGSEFHVLLSSINAIVEDMETLDHIKWQLLVIDECQHPVISTHLKKIQMLMADMKLLTVSDEPVDILQSYRNILSLVDCENEKIHNDADMDMNDDISILKERLSPFIAFECNLKRTQKDPSPVTVLQIPASELARSMNSCLTSGPTTHLPGHSFAQSGLRLPAPHLRSSPSLFGSVSNQPASGEGEPSLEPLSSLSATQTVDKHSPV